jgi:hypothetical protein
MRYFIIFLTLSACAVTQPETVSESALKPFEPTLPEPGVRMEGDTLIAIGCVTGIRDIGLARDVAELRGRSAAVRAACSSGRATMYGSFPGGMTVAGNTLCMEVSVEASGIRCD